MENETKKPTRRDGGWHLKTRYVDDNGDVYSKGKFTGETIDVQIIISDPTTIAEQVTVTEQVETTNPKKEVEIPSREAELLKRIDELQSLVNAAIIGKGKDAVIINAREEEKFGTIKAKDMPADDYEEAETTFICRGRGKPISVYYNNAGAQVLAPYRQPIYFQYTYTDKHKRGNDEDIVHYAVYKTHSKAEKKFLRESPFYNVVIFESVVAAAKYDMATANKMANLAAWVESLGHDQLFGEASRRGVSLEGKSTTELKNYIMLARFDELEKEQKQFTESHLSRMQEGIFDKK